MTTLPHRLVAGIGGGAAIVVLASLVGAAPAAVSAPGSNKVTICHRTHSVTNPYRMITVNANAADGLGRSDHTSHDLAFELDGTIYPIFDPSIDYPANQKHWGDIIPPVRSSPGLNWDEPGAQDIYLGVGEAFGLCGRMSAKQYFDVEVAALPDDLTPEERSTALDEILADLDEQGALEDDAVKTELGVSSFAELDHSALPPGFQNAPSRPRGPRPPAGFGPQSGMQKLAVVVWWDTDRDGEFDDDELPAEGITVVIEPTLTAVLAARVSPAVGATTTDADGEVIVDSLDAGQWDVTAAVPDGSDVTWDSEGASDDAAAQVEVPADSAGFAWVGLDPVDGATDGGTTDGGTTDGGTTDDSALAGGESDLAATGPSTLTPALAGVAALLVALGAALLRSRTRPRGRHAAH